MVELVYENPEIYRIYVPLPQNPLKALNSYLIKLGDRNLLVDTGFNRPECHEALVKGLEELNVDMNKTDVFLTHLHSDHSGLINKVATENTKIYLGKIDCGYLFENLEGFNWERIEKRFTEEGFPTDVAEALRKTNQARAFAPDHMFDAIQVEDGDKFEINGVEFTVVFTPGHTPGHTCLYIEREELLFSGDHILFDITPNITAWMGVKDSLKNYIDSLRKVKELKIKTTLPGHRGTYETAHDRIDEIIGHHDIRLRETLDIVTGNSEGKGLTAYEVAPFMKWSMRGKPWSEFPDNQKWFAVGETMSHLDYLVNENKIMRYMDDETGLYRYKIVK